jgi:two-component system, OmpR family, phosphate regulon response regulator PhoB
MTFVMVTAMSKILVVEDEKEILELLALHLRREGHEVVQAENGNAAVAAAERENVSLAVLDWMLPGKSGLELTKWLRSEPRFAGLPILFVTAKSDPVHIAEGLNAGADDYLPKPFDPMVFMARVNALLRRGKWLEERTDKSLSSPGEVRLGNLVLLIDLHEVHMDGKKLDLTRSEFRLLEALMMNQGKVLSRENLIECIQGEGVNVVGRTIDTHVFGLRKKLASSGDLIETIRGVGYRVRFQPLVGQVE